MTFAHTDGFTTDELPPERPKAEGNGRDQHQDKTKKPRKPKASDLGFSLGDWSVPGNFAGPAQPMRWLVDQAVPLGVPCLIAATGDTGKSFTILELCMRVAWKFRCGPLEPSILGGQVKEHGSAIFITAEDSQGTVHRRLEAIDPSGDWRRKSGLYIVPLPSVKPAEGEPRLPFTLVEKEIGIPVRTPQYEALRIQLRKIPNLKLIALDPLQAVTTVNLSDPAEAQFVATALVDLAAETGATVIVSHHLRKSDTPPKTPEEARQMIRGSTAIVDGVRVAIALWSLPEREGRDACKKLDEEYKPHRVVNSCVVKTNDNASRTIRALLRQSNGLLHDVTEALAVRTARPSELLTSMRNAIERLALAGSPVTKTGVNGVFERRAELGFDLKNLARNQLWALVDDLEHEKLIVRAMAVGSTTVKWLDVPDGPFARGEGQFVHGASTAKSGPKDRRKPNGSAV